MLAFAKAGDTIMVNYTDDEFRNDASVYLPIVDCLKALSGHDTPRLSIREGTAYASFSDPLAASIVLEFDAEALRYLLSKMEPDGDA